MKGLHNIQFVLIFVGMAYLSSCKEKDETKSQPQNLGFISAGEAKDYLVFKKGTYWVYKNSLTQELDSMILTSCNLDTLHAEGDKRIFDYEEIDFVIKSMRDNATYHTYDFPPNPDVLNFDFGWAWQCNRSGGEYSKYQTGSHTSAQFYYPFSKESLGNGSYHIKFIEKKDSLSVSSQTYYKLATFLVTHDVAFPYPNSYYGDYWENKYYWAPNYGLVKVEMVGWDPNNIKTSMNWDLIKSHIVK